MRKPLLAGPAAIALVAAFAAPAHATMDSQDTTVTAVDGLLATPVDVYANDTVLMDDLEPGTLSGPVSIDPGNYEFSVVEAGAADASSPIVGPISVDVEEGDGISIVAYADSAGAPMLTSFKDGLMPVQDPSNGQLVLRPFAAMESAELTVDGDVLISGLGLGTGMTSDVPAGEHEVSVSATADPNNSVGPLTVTVEPGKAVTLYTVGSLEEGTLTLLADTGERTAAGDGAASQPSVTASASASASRDGVAQRKCQPRTRGDRGRLRRLQPVVVAPCGDRGGGRHRSRGGSHQKQEAHPLGALREPFEQFAVAGDHKKVVGTDGGVASGVLEVLARATSRRSPGCRTCCAGRGRSSVKLWVSFGGRILTIVKPSSTSM